MHTLRNGFLAATAALACAATAHPATASAAFRPVAKAAASAPRSDGGRWVAYAPARDTIRVIDERTGTAWNERIPCATSTYDRDLVTAVGGGAAIVACADPVVHGGRPLLLDLTTRTWHEIPGAAALLPGYVNDLDRIVFDAVGTRWVHATGSYYHGRNDYWLDRKTGALGPQPTAETASDLDATGLNVPLCAPLRRRETGSDAQMYGAPRYHGIAVDGKLAVTYGTGGAAARPSLLRCGSDVALPLDRSATSANDVQFRDGLVTWRGDIDHAYLTACGVRLSWRERTDGWIHSQRSLYRATLPAGPAPVAISRAPLPTCRSALGAATVRASSGGRTTAAALVSGRWLAADGADADLLPGGRPRGSATPLLRLGADRTLTLKTSAATRIRWRAGGDSGAARRVGGRWLVKLPARLRGTTPLTLTVRDDTGYLDATHRLALRAPR